MLDLRERLPFHTAPLYGILGVTFGLSLAYAVALRSQWRLPLQSLVQCALDLTLVSLLVHFTGGLDSVFPFMYILVIFAASNVLERGAGLTVGIVSGFLYAGLILAEWTRIIRPVEFAGGLAPLRSVGYAVYQVLSHTVAFLAVAILSSHLADRLRQAGQELERRGLDLRSLQTLHRAIVANISSGLMTLDLAGRVVSFNEAAERITGYAFADLRDRPWQETPFASCAPLAEFIADPGAPLANPLTEIASHGGMGASSRSGSPALPCDVPTAGQPAWWRSSRTSPSANGWRSNSGAGSSGGPRATGREYRPPGAEPVGGHQRRRGSASRGPGTGRTESGAPRNRPGGSASPQPDHRPVPRFRQARVSAVSPLRVRPLYKRHFACWTEAGSATPTRPGMSPKRCRTWTSWPMPTSSGKSPGIYVSTRSGDAARRALDGHRAPVALGICSAGTVAAAVGRRFVPDAAAPGTPQPADGPKRNGWRSPFRTPGVASPRNRCSASSTPSSQRDRREPGWAWPSPRRSWRAWADRWRRRAGWDPERRFAFGCGRRQSPWEPPAEGKPHAAHPPPTITGVRGTGWRPFLVGLG